MQFFYSLCTDIRAYKCTNRIKSFCQWCSLWSKVGFHKINFYFRKVCKLFFKRFFIVTLCIIK